MKALDVNFSTTRRVIKTNPQVIIQFMKQSHKPEDEFEARAFLPTCEGREVEGGLRTKNYFNVGGLIPVEVAASEEMGRYEDHYSCDKDEDRSSSLIRESQRKFKPLITVVTVVFNGEKCLEETILSVINQTYDNLEYIIIDGGSTDGTLEIIKKYEHAISYWASEKDKGIYDAMNKGIDLATGAWINFLNAGDCFFQDNILGDRIIPLTQNTNLIYGAVNLISPKSNIITLQPKKFTRMNLFIWGTRVACHQTIFVNRSILTKYSTRYILKGELDWYFRLTESVLKPGLCSDPMVKYSLGGLGDIRHWRNFFEATQVSLRNNFILGLLSLPLLIVKLCHKCIK
jgi:hypothetical protein